MPSPSRPRRIKIKRLALCIGLSHYSNFSPLPAARKDAQAVAARLLDPKVGGFEEVILLTDDCQRTLKPGDSLDFLTTSLSPTMPVDRARLHRAVEQAFEGYIFDADSLLVIFFAGHGAPNNNHELFLFGDDGKLSSARKPLKPDFSTGLDLNSQLSNFLAAENAPTSIVVLLDVCYAGVATGLAERLQPFARSKNDKLRQIYLIGGAQADQSAGGAGGHGYFTACLLEALNQRPVNGWISMSRVQEEVARRLPQAGGGKGQQIEGINLFGSNIGLAQNPAYDPHSTEFYQEVQKILRLDDNWSTPVRPDEATDPSAFFQVHSGKSEFSAVDWAIYCLDNEKIAPWPVLVENIALLLARIPAVQKRLLVTRHELTPEMAGIARAVCPGLLITTPQTIMRESMDFSQYEREIAELYRHGDESNSAWRVPPLGEVYVQLRGYEEVFVTEKGVSVDVDEKEAAELFRAKQLETRREEREVKWRGDLEEGMREWLNSDDPAQSRAVLTGTYGTGKSSFCLHLAAMLLEDKHPRKPILINLADFAGRQQRNFQGFLQDFLDEKGVGSVTAAKLERWAEAGLLFFIFDGFDEMASSSVDTVKESNLAYIEKWANIPNNKVLVTTRPEYFLTRADEREMLRSYRRFFCSLLTRSQIDEYLERRLNWHTRNPRQGLTQRLTWQQYRARIDQTYDLSDLQHRFVLLELIVKTLPRYIEQNRQEVTRIDLYRDYLQMELEDRLLDHKELAVVKLIPLTDRLALLEELAYRLYRDQTRQNERRFGAEEARDWLLTLPMPSEVRRTLERNWTSFLTYSFLIPAGEDSFEFSHKSFLEYLVAVRLDRQLRENDLSGLALRPLSREIADFLAELNPPTDGLLKAADAPDADGTLVYSTGQLLLSRRLYRLNRRLFVSEKDQTAVLDGSYLTCIEYGVFVDDLIRQERYYYPDHWTQPRFGPGTALQPLAGLRDTDNQAFCAWLNSRIAGNQDNQALEREEKERAYVYRLPGINEFETLLLPSDYPLLAPWCGQSPYFRLAEATATAHEVIKTALAGLSEDNGLPPADYNTLALVRALALNRALDRALDRARDRALALDLARDRALALDLARIFNYTEVAEALQRKEWQLARQGLLKLEQTRPDELTRRRVGFVEHTVNLAAAENIEEYRQAHRGYAAFYALLVYPTLEELERQYKQDYGEEKEALARLYWAQKLTEARRADPNFPVWESLRLVCARRQPEEDDEEE